jgi:hypothetical protein
MPLSPYFFPSLHVLCFSIFEFLWTLCVVEYLYSLFAHLKWKQLETTGKMGKQRVQIFNDTKSPEEFKNREAKHFAHFASCFQLFPLLFYFPT